MPKARLKPGMERRIGDPELHPGQLMVEAEADAILAASGGHGVFYLCAHRGWWKSSFVLGRVLRHLATGMPAGWYAPTNIPLKDTRENLFKKALGVDFFDECYNYSDGILRIPGMGSLHFFSLLEEDAARGPTYPFIVGDEWGALPDGVQQRIINPIIQKAIVAYDGVAEAWFTGTPNPFSPKNHFYHNIMSAIGGTIPSTMGWIIPVSADVDNDRDTLVYKHNPYANPFYKFDKLKAEYENPATRKKAWQVEWLCRFISDEGGQFERDAIEAQCVLPFDDVPVPIADTSIRKRPLEASHRGKQFVTYRLRGWKPNPHGWYQVGIDIGFSQDRCSIQVLDRNTNKMVYMHHFLPFGQDRWFLIYEAIALCARMFPGAKINVDAGGLGSHVAETMRRDYGIRITEVKFGGMNKEPILNHASSLLEQGQVWLFNLPILKEELNGMERKVRVGTSGFKIAAPKGHHDDAPMAFALMVHGIHGIASENTGDVRTFGATANSVFHYDEHQITVINPYDAGGFAAAWDNHGILSPYTG